MSPHSDTPSAASSYHRAAADVPLRSAAAGSTLRSEEPSSVYSEPEFSSSFSSSASGLDASQSPIPRKRPLIPGVYVPTVCFFTQPSEDLDLPTIASHAVRLARAGVTGIATQGSNGEAVHLSHAERQLVTSTTRKALTDAGFDHLPIIVGCGAQSTREALAYCKEAFQAGGDYALVLPPSYYAPLFAPDSKSIRDFFTALADQSPIPLIIYNYPGAVSGLDLGSDLIIDLSRHANVAGVKLTCGNTGKLNRIVAATKASPTSSSSTAAAAPLADAAPPFLVLGGSADFTLQALVGGGHGILAGLANLAPKACLEILRLHRLGDLRAAQELQEVVARGDWAAIQGGIVGTKAGMEACLGYGGAARAPLPRATQDETARWAARFKELMGLEKSL